MCFEARPKSAPNTLGTGFTRSGNHFEFDNFNLKGDRNGLINDKLKYSVEVKENVHSFDYEMSVESVQCFDDYFIVATNDKSIERWGENSLVSGSPKMWNCMSSMNRKILKVVFMYEEDGFYYYKLETKKAYIDEYFESAKVLYYPKLRPQTTDILTKQNQSPEFNNNTQSNGKFSNVIYKRVYVDNEVGSIVAPMTQIASPMESKPIVKTMKGASDNPFVILSPSSLASVAGNEKFCVEFSLKSKESLSAVITLIVKEPGILKDKEIKQYKFDQKTFKKGVIESYCFDIEPSVYDDNEEYKIYFNAGSSYKEISSKTFGFIVEQFQPLAITTPTSGQVFDLEKTKQINVEWDFTKFEYKSATMKLMRGRVGIDETVSSQKIKDMSSKKDVFKIPSSVKLSSSTKYYFKFEFNCWNIPIIGISWCSHAESSTFSIINTAESGGIVILTPSFGESYKTGDNIIITWENGATDENEDLTISLKKDSGLFHGPYSSVKAKGKDKKVTIPVPNLSDNTRYYIEMEYGSGIIKTYAYSDQFSINHEQLIVFGDDDIQYDKTAKQLKISFRTITHKPLDDDYFITINNDLPMFLIIDPSDTTIEIGDMKKTDKSTYYEYSITLDNYDEEASFLWKYVTINYDCLFMSYFCEHEYSRRFSIPISDVGGWNYDGKEEKIINETIPFYSISCDDDCKKEEDKLKHETFCSLCDKGIKTGLSIDCENCHIRTENGFGEFEFEMGPKGIGKARLHFYGILYAYFAIVTKFTGQYTYSYKNDLFKYPLVGTPEIDLGLVQLQFGAEIFGGFKLNFELSGEITLTVGFEKEYQYYIDVTYPPTSMKPDEIGNEYVKALIEETKFNKIFDVEAQVTAKLTFVPTVGVRAGVEIIELKGSFNFPLVNMLTFQYPAFPAAQDSTDLALVVKGMNVPHYLEYDLDFEIDFEMYYKFNLIIWKTNKTTIYPIYNKKLVKLGLITLNDGKKLAQIPMKLLEGLFKEEEANAIINDIQKDIVKLVSDTTKVEVQNKDTFAGDTKQVNTDENTNSEIINVGFTNSQFTTEDISLICEKIKNIDSLGDEYSSLKKYQQYIDGCGNIQVENPSLNVPDEPEPDPDVLITSPTEPINVEIGNYISVKVKFGSRFSGQTISVTAKCYFFFLEKNKLVDSQEKEIKVNPSNEYSFDFETSKLSEGAQYIIEIGSSSFDTVSSPLFTIVEKTSGVYPVNIIIQNQPEEYEDLLIYKVSLQFKGDMIGKNVPIKFEFKKMVSEDIVETIEVLPGEVIVADKIYDFEVRLTGKLYSYNGVYFATISAQYSSGVNGNQFEVPFDTDIDGTILSCYPGPKSPLFTIFTVGECLQGRYGYFKAEKSGSTYVVNKYSHDKCSRSPDETDYYSEHVCTTEPLDLKEIASLYFFNSVEDNHRSSHYAAINNYFNKKDPKNPKIPRYIYSFVIGEPVDYNYLYVRDYDNQKGGIAPKKISIKDNEASYQEIPQDTLYDFKKVYVSFDENEMKVFENIDHDGYVGDCSGMDGCLVCSDTECKMCHETYTLSGSQCTPNVCSFAGCGNCTSTTCIRCSDGSIPDGNVCPSSNCNKFNGCSYCTGTKCLKCKEGFSLNEKGQCNEVDCSDFDGCTSCSVSECLTCSNGKDPVDGLCVSTECSSFDGCTECTKNKCTICEDGYELVTGNCQKYDCSKMPKCTKCNDVECFECENDIDLIDGSCKQETCEAFTGCKECSYAQCIKCDKGYYLNEKGNCILNDCSSLLNCKKCDNDECMESLDGLEMINGISYPSNCYEKDNCYRCDSEQCVQCVNGKMSNQCEKVEKEVYCLRNDMFINKIKIGDCYENADGTASMYAYDGKGFVHVHYYGSIDCGLSGNPTAVPQIIDTCVEEINLEKINSRGFVYYDYECNETYKSIEIFTSSECISFGDSYIKTKQTSNKIYVMEYETNDCSGVPLSERNYEVNSCSETLEGVKYQITYDSSFDCEVEDCEKCVEGKTDQCELCIEGFDKSIDGKSCIPESPSSCTVANCEECVEGNSNKCYTCKSGFKVNSNGKCEEESNNNGYGDPNGCNSVVIQRDEECNGNYYTIYECSTSCKPGYSKKSVQPCSNSHSYDYCEKVSVTCSVDNCEACSSVDYCEKCYSSYYTNNGKCNKCPNNCISCEDETGKCNSCVNGYSWNNIECVKCSEHCEECSFDENGVEICGRCEKGYSQKSNKCSKCSEHCVECSFESTGKEKCSKCENKYKVNSETGLCEEIVAHSSEEISESSSSGFLMLYLVLVLVLIL